MASGVQDWGAKNQNLIFPWREWETSRRSWWPTRWCPRSNSNSLKLSIQNYKCWNSLYFARWSGSMEYLFKFCSRRFSLKTVLLSLSWLAITRIKIITELLGLEDMFDFSSKRFILKTVLLFPSLSGFTNQSHKPTYLPFLADLPSLCAWLII